MHSLDGVCGHCSTAFEGMACYYHFCSCQKARSSLTAEQFQRSITMRELGELRKGYIQEKGYGVIEMYESDLWNM